jgi:hypothetical protein
LITSLIDLHSSLSIAYPRKGERRVVRLGKPGKEFPPLIQDGFTVEQNEWVRLGSLGLMEQLHPGLLWRVPGFLVVAWDTRTGDILPDMGAASVTRHYMVDGEVLSLLAAVLANVAVPDEYFLSGKAVLLNRPLHHVDQPDDRGDVKGRLRRMNLSSSILQHLRFSTTKETYCAADVADIEGFIILIKKQYGQLQGAQPPPPGIPSP